MQTNLNTRNPASGAGVAVRTFDWLRTKTDRLTSARGKFAEGRRSSSSDHSWQSLSPTLAFGALV